MLGLLIASAIAIVLLFVPFASYVTYPCNLFVTLIHESSHAFAALITGGGVESIKIEPDASGVTFTRGGIVPMIVSAGYIGATAFGFFLLRLLGAGRSRLAATLTSIFVLFMALSFGANSLTLFTGIVAGVLCALLAYWGNTHFVSPVMSFLAVQCILNSFYDLRTLLAISAMDSRQVSDAQILSSMFGGVIPPIVWALSFSAVSLGVAYVALRGMFRKQFVSS